MFHCKAHSLQAQLRCCLVVQGSARLGPRRQAACLLCDASCMCDSKLMDASKTLAALSCRYMADMAIHLIQQTFFDSLLYPLETQQLTTQVSSHWQLDLWFQGKQYRAQLD